MCATINSSPGLIASSLYFSSYATWACAYIWLIRKSLGFHPQNTLWKFTSRNILSGFIALTSSFTLLIFAHTTLYTFNDLYGFFGALFLALIIYGTVMAFLNRDLIVSSFFKHALMYILKGFLTLLACFALGWCLFYLFDFLLDTSFMEFLVLYIGLGLYGLFLLGPFFLIAFLHIKQLRNDTGKQFADLIMCAAMAVALTTGPYVFEALIYVFE